MNPYDQTLQSVAAENPYDQTVRRVYHGTPHKFAPTVNNPLGEFDHSKMGTGEGAQAYGWGTYVAEHKPIAKGYRDIISSKYDPREYITAIIQTFSDYKTPFTDENLKKELNEYPQTKPLANDQHVISLIKKAASGYEGLPSDSWTSEGLRALKQLDSHLPKVPKGSLYHVEVPQHHIDRMLDWDKPLKHQHEHVRKALRRADLVDEHHEMHPGAELGGRATGNLTGGGGADLYHSLESQWKNEYGPDELLSIDAKSGKEAASKYLHSLGIPGIKYLDAASRGADEKNPTRNFVLFDPSIAKIVERE